MKIIIGIIIAFELIAFAGNSEFVKSYNEKAEQEEVVVDHSMDGYHELKTLQDELYDLDETEIEGYLEANNIQYTAKDVNEGKDRYIRVAKGNWELEVLYDINYCIDPWITLESTLVE